MNSIQFSEHAEDTLQTIADVLEEADNEYALEIDLIDGTLTIELPDAKQYVISKHEASEQIWLSSPISGGSHFSYDEEDDIWISSDSSELYEVLSEEFKELADLDLRF